MPTTVKKAKKGREVTALMPWFGSNRSLAENVGRALAGCTWVGVPFAGSMTELRHIDAATLVVSDKHRHLINLATVVAHPTLGPRLIRELRRTLFHPDVLRRAQEVCAKWEGGPTPGDDASEFGSSEFNYQVAYHYFITGWMGRSAQAGTDAEFKGKLPVRWDAGGGDSCTRFRSATEALRQWRQVFRRCNFLCVDVFDFLANVKDRPDHGVYLDPPFPDAGDPYRHKFTPALHRRLARRLAEFRACRVVCRFYDHDLVRELYPPDRWDWHDLAGGKKQSNEKAPEVLLTLKGDMG